MLILNLGGPQLGPELEQEEDPAPLLLLGRLHSPPSEAGEQEVGDDACVTFALIKLNCLNHQNSKIH